MQILVVDDDPHLADLLAEFLRGAGHTVDVVADGREALDRLRPGGYDVAFVDYELPGLSGIDLLRAARDRVPDTALVLMSRYTNVDVAMEAMKSGAVDFVAKPLEPAALDRVLESIRRETRATTEGARAGEEPQEAVGGPAVRAAFLTNRAGLLLASRVVPGERTVDEDLFGATLDVIQNFMRVSFPGPRGGSLKAIRQGDRTLVLEPGEEAFLAVLVRGEETEDLRRAMRAALRDFERENRGRFEEAVVDAEDFSGRDELLDRVMTAGPGSQAKPKRS